ncbi:MAG: hypothetical protein CML47_01895 [Rhodobacteraceae bacterium]|nr:MAG: hypothetical protein CML47_01895 [Paracoccaceae bacterium]|tara:strand:+ start:2015 stop:2809 length:795 start_codon:yes stop_codon:yes gene_type:complete
MYNDPHQNDIIFNIDKTVYCDYYFPKKQYYYRNYLSRAQIIQILKNIETQWKIANETNFNTDEMITIMKNIRNLKSKFNLNYGSSWQSYEWYRQGPSIKDFLSEISYRINTIMRDRLTSIRSIKRVLGSFEESISPKMIHKILTWLKKTNPDIYGNVKRDIKENIIRDLKSYGIKIDAMLLSNFIDENNPIEFVKEWNIKTHKNGKRMKNSEIRELFKKAFYEKQENIFRSHICMPRLNSLPDYIENIIFSYLTGCNKSIHEMG